MTARFVALASGSAGNASLLSANGFAVMIDCGLGRRALASRMARRGFSWKNVNAVVLTHTHTDHWNESTLAAIREHRILVYCHPEHAGQLTRMSGTFRDLTAAELVQHYVPDVWLGLSSMRLMPTEISHDGEPAFGFRVEGPSGLFGAEWAVGYLTDLGTWTGSMARHFADVDLLAVEFNHDEHMQRTSGRPRILIERVLGDRGHLSNHQAAEFVKTIRSNSVDIPLRFLVTLHRSRECNRPELVEEAALAAVGTGVGRVEVHIAEQDVPTEIMHLSRKLPRSSVPRSRRRMPNTHSHGFFNGAG